jgi:hypothetical protein
LVDRSASGDSGSHQILSSSRRTCRMQRAERREIREGARLHQQARLLSCSDASGGPSNNSDLVSPATQRYKPTSEVAGASKKKKKTRLRESLQKVSPTINSTVIPSPLSSSSLTSQPSHRFFLSSHCAALSSPSPSSGPPSSLSSVSSLLVGPG